jgi:hypothetical protein
MSDAFTSYETGLTRLLGRLGSDHPRYTDVLVYQQRLQENIAQARKYGDTDALKHARAQIVDELNRLALETVGISLGDLSSEEVPPLFESPKPVFEKSDWNTAAIRDLLTAAFNDEEVTTLCFDHFRPVYENLAAGMSKGQKIQRLLDYCERHNRIPELLSRVRRANPSKYTEFKSHLEQRPEPELPSPPRPPTEEPPDTSAPPSPPKSPAEEPPVEIPRRAWGLLALLFLDFCLVILWGWCLFGDQPSLIAYLGTVAAIVALLLATLAIILKVGRPIVLEDVLLRLAADQGCTRIILLSSGLIVVITLLFWPLGWVGKCVSTPTPTPTMMPTPTPSVALIVAPTSTDTPSPTPKLTLSSTPTLTVSDVAVIREQIVRDPIAGAKALSEYLATNPKWTAKRNEVDLKCADLERIQHDIDLFGPNPSDEAAKSRVVYFLLRVCLELEQSEQ